MNTVRLAPHRYFLLVFLLSCALLAGFTYTLYQQSQDYERYNNQTLRSYEILYLARRVMNYALNMETGQRGYLLTGSKEFLEPYARSKTYLLETVSQLEATVANSSQQRDTFALLKKRLESLQDVIDKQIETFDKQHYSRLKFEDLEEGRLLMEQVRNTLGEFIAGERALLITQNEKIKREQKQYLITLFLGAALAIGGLLVANLIIVGLLAKGKKTEETLRSFEESYRLILENTDDGVFDYYPQTGEVRYSPSYAAMLGYEPSELESTIHTFNRLVHPDDLEANWELADKFIHRETPNFSIVLRMRHKDGSLRWVLSRALGVWNSKGEIQRILGTHTDITEQKQREEELRQVNAELESFIYIASHDLRAPLVNLKGFATEIELSIQTLTPAFNSLSDNIERQRATLVRQIMEKDIPESLGFIRSSVERMDALTTAILDLSRLGRREYKQEAVHTNDIVKRCIDSLTYEINNKNAAVTFDDLPEVMTDRVALEQLFGNILDNAVKYLLPDRPGKIHISAKQRFWETEFIIEDNGRGIAPSDHSRIYDIFRRASNSGNVRGAGMGMAYAKTTLRRLGGRIWFESTLNEGSVFHFTIPRRSTLFSGKQHPSVITHTPEAA